MTLDKMHVAAFLVAATLALYSVYSFESNRAEKAEVLADSAKQQAVLIQAQNQSFQAQVTAQIAQLSAANQALTSALAKQQLLDKTLSPTQLGGRVASLVNVPTTDITPLANGHFDLTPQAVLAAALQLEEVPVLTQKLDNETKAFDAEVQAHKSDNTASAATLASCKANLADVKAKARKSKIKWFFAGVVVGFAGRAAIP
jgi:hypothetical protein